MLMQHTHTHLHSALHAYTLKYPPPHIHNHPIYAINTAQIYKHKPTLAQSASKIRKGHMTKYDAVLCAIAGLILHKGRKKKDADKQRHCCLKEK